MIVVQNPSIVLAAIVVAFGRLTRRWRVAVDAHNVAIEQLSANSWLLRQVARALVRYANVTIVTNAPLAAIVKWHGGNPIVLPDCLPHPDLRQLPAPKHDRTSTAVTVISTFAADEPIEEILGAAETLGASYRFAFTGRPDGWRKTFRGRIPPNVGFSGFVPDAAYWQLLASSDVIVDISTRKHCLVCGAYEALAIGRPIVLTDDPSARQLFTSIAIFAEPESQSIASAIVEACAQHSRISAGSDAARTAYLKVWFERARDLTEELGIAAIRSRQRSSGTPFKPSI